MCSVVGCESWRRTVPRFKLPEDPENRLQWVQFLLEVNGQRLKETSWTDITICSEHFAENCFESQTDTVQLKPDAVPSLCTDPAAYGPEPDVSRTSRTESVEAVCHDEKQDRPRPHSEKSKTSKTARKGSSRRRVSRPTAKSDCLKFEYGPMLQSTPNIDMIKKKAALLQTKGKYVVNEKRLFELFPRKCPLCGSKLKLEKFTHGLVIIVKQQCLQCEFRNQWKSQANASIPEDQDLTGGTEINLEPPQTEQSDDHDSTVGGVSEISAARDEEYGPVEEQDYSAQGEMDSDEEWKPIEEPLPEYQIQSDSDEESEELDIKEEPVGSGDGSKGGTKLCTECGVFFRKRWPHTCEYKTKPFSCNTCGKRCVSEAALSAHGRIHDDNYEFRCKFCHITLKTKADKVSHEQIHVFEENPYKCSECSETFGSRKDRNDHLQVHRGSEQLTCRICGIEFYRLLSIKRHMLIHTGVKPYKCPVCERGFNQASHLKSHMRLHTGERPFKCEHCDKSFTHNVSLKSHIQRYHTFGGEKSCPDVELENVADEDKKQERKEKRVPAQKGQRRSTGRPVGRPKRNVSGNVDPSSENEGQLPTKRRKHEVPKRWSSDEEDEELFNRYAGLYSDEEEEEGRSSKMAEGSSRSRSTANDTDSDPEFDREDQTDWGLYNEASSSVPGSI